MPRKIYIHIKILAGVSEKNILLRGAALNELGIINNAYLKTNDKFIEDHGRMADLDFTALEAGTQIIDLTGKIILPSWVDSHTHLVHAASREEEFIAKLKGASYEEIAAMGGGILNSANKIATISEDDLLEISMTKLQTAIASGTGAMEIKSGYGLSVEGELKMLRVIKEMKRISPIPIKASFLGAHGYPVAFKNNHQEYIRQIIKEMLPAIAKESLADYVDVFCERGFFSPEEMIQICIAAKEYGLLPKLHINQLNSIGGVKAGIALNAVSLDHLETLNGDEIKMIGDSKSIATLLPTAAFFLRMQYPPARNLIDENAAVSIASDFNPGSSPSSNMNFVAAISAVQMKLLPHEVINAGTINAAFAMDVQHLVGNIQEGKLANFIITKQLSSLDYLFYDFAANHISDVVVNGVCMGS